MGFLNLARSCRSDPVDPQPIQRLIHVGRRQAQDPAITGDRFAEAPGLDEWFLAYDGYPHPALHLMLAAEESEVLGKLEPFHRGNVPLDLTHIDQDTGKAQVGRLGEASIVNVLDVRKGVMAGARSDHRV